MLSNGIQVEIHKNALRCNSIQFAACETLREIFGMPNHWKFLCKLNVTQHGKCKIYIQLMQSHRIGGRARVANSERTLIQVEIFNCFSCDAVRKNVNVVNEWMLKSKKKGRGEHDVEWLNSIRFDERKETFYTILDAFCFFVFFFTHLSHSLCVCVWVGFALFHSLHHARTNVLLLVDTDEWTISSGSDWMSKSQHQKPISNPSIALF